MSEISRKIAGLSPEKRALLELLTQEEGVDLSRSMILPQKRDSNQLPLSFAQQRLWFLDQLEPESALYNIPTAVHLSGKLDLQALTRCLDVIISRHEVLRTTFSSKDGQPYQIIAPAPLYPASLTIPLSVIDLSGLLETRREAEAMRIAREEAGKPFDLEHGPVLRATLLCLGDNDHIVLLTMHHIASDGWSMGILIQEISILYTDFTQAMTDLPGAGHASGGLPELPIQYADYAVWQRNWLQGEVLEEQLAYWKKQLGGNLPVLVLPSDRPRSAVLSTRGSHLSFRFPLSLTRRLQDLCQKENVTLFMALIAGFYTLLQRYTGQEDICVGTPIANRTRPEVEGLIGFFANTLALRVDLSGDLTFQELLQRVRKVTLEAYDHQDIPFEMLVDHLTAARDMSFTPLFQVMFTLQNAPMQAQQLTGLTLSSVSTHSGTSKFDLTLVMAEGQDHLSGSLEFNEDLFDAATINRIVGHFQILLEGASRDPAKPISSYPLLSDEERQKLLSFSAPEAAPSYPPMLCIHELVEKQAKRTPNKIAVCFESQTMTYQEIDQRANQLAQYLHKLGIGPDVMVALFMDRSLELVVAILGILKAGGAYLPIDLSYPPDRQAFMLEDAKVPVILTEDARLESLPPTSAKVICLDRDWPEITREYDFDSPEIRVSGLKPDNLAYVIYTSGSTGKPKGVMVTHHNVVRLFEATEDWYHFNEQDVWSLFHSYAFDFSVWEMWGALFYGGRLVIVPYLVSRSPQAFYELLVKERVTVLNQTPSAFRQLIRAEETLGVSPDLALRYVIFGGEALELQSLKPWYDRHGDQLPRLINMYGITETTVHVSYRPIFLRDLSTATGSVIGGPIPDLKLFILDKHLQPTPIGVPGELCVGGAGLARGYLNRQELTATKFIPNPFSKKSSAKEVGSHSAVPSGNDNQDEKQERLYRSGDLARYLPDGDIEYLGRIDLQVKIRGFRVELGEIESVLGSHPGVRENVVLIREDTPGDKRLVAYVVSAKDEALVISDLRRTVQEKLPDYMVPSFFVVLDTLPLTANGKIDRRALPPPDQTSRELESHYVAPRTPEEEILANIWGQILGVGQVGVNDNFFELGGHSLLATQVASRIRDVFQIELPLRVLFENATVAGLAQQLSTIRMAAEEVQGSPIQPVPREGELPLSFAQQRLWFLDQFEPGTPFYNIPFAVRLTGTLDIPALEQSLNAIISRHEILRTVIQTVNGRAVQVVLPELIVSLPPEVLFRIIDLQHLPETEREKEAQRLALQESLKPFDLSKGPLLRGLLFRLSAEDHFAILTLHHIITDGWSSSIFIRELAAFYQYFRMHPLYPAAPSTSSIPTFSSATGFGETSFEDSHALVSGLPADGLYRSLLSPLPIQYADFAVWQRNWLQGEILETELDYWKEKLGGELPVLNLPTDRPRPIVQTARGSHYSFELSGDLSRKIFELSRKEGATVFMTLLAAFYSLLYRYTGQEDICIGTPIANRTRSELEALIGFFVNTLVLRTDLSGEPSFLELLSRVRQSALEAYAHQDVPFEMLINEIQPERDMSHSPLFQAMFVMQNIPRQDIELPGLKLSSVLIDTGISNFDLTLAMEGDQGGLIGSFEFNTDLFDTSTIARMVEHFKILLEGIVSTPDLGVSKLSLLTEEEKQLLLVTWNDTQASFSNDLCLHQLIEQQVERTPEAIAVVYPDGNGDPGSTLPQRSTTDVTIFNDRKHRKYPSALTYQELNSRSNQLAHYLQTLGVRPDSLVGICAERSLEMVVGILGILKAGGAYLPLDPNYPLERLEYMVKDSGVSILLTQEKLKPRLTDLGGDFKNEGRKYSSAMTGDHPKIVYLDTDWEQISFQNCNNPFSQVTPENLAYVIYTSGSTGKPKGVMIPQRAVVNHNQAVARAFNLKPTDRVLQFATINFDTAAEEIFPTWISGATLVLRTDNMLASGAELLRLIEKEGLTVLDLPTAYWHEWVYELSLAGSFLPSCLRLVIVGGEKALKDRYDTWLKVGGSNVEWLNTYGPTEATIISALFEPDAEYASPEPGDADSDVADVPSRLIRNNHLWEERSDLPIGRPIANTQLYVLDRHMQPVPVGVVGELHIGGTGLARGYLKRPELTAEKFIPSDVAAGYSGYIRAPFQDSRLYKTGDLARYRPDGNIEYLGRIDQQVKVRGFRVELGEIETALRGHPGVRDAVVLARTDLAAEARQMMRLGSTLPQDTSGISDRKYSSAESGVLRLVAYVIPASYDGQVDRKYSSALTVKELRSYLKEILPEFMVPAVFVMLEEFPLTPNRKVDRKALPKPEGARPELDTAFEAPRTSKEEVLASTWRQVLGLEKVGMQDNFFELGGDSILSIQVIARANQAGLRLTPRQLFENPTLAGLASVADQGKAIHADQGLVTGIAPLTPIQHWFFEQGFPDPHHWNQSLLFEVRYPLKPDLLKESFRRLLAHHDALRARFEPEEGVDEMSHPVYRMLFPPAVPSGIDIDLPFEQINLSKLDPQQQKETLEAYAATVQASLNLENGPLVCMVYYDLGTEKTARLLLVIHHLVVDGVSWRILLEDLQSIYREVSQDLKGQLPPRYSGGLRQPGSTLPPLPAKTTSYPYWAQQLVAYSHSDELLQELPFWQAMVEEPISPIPVDFQGGENSEASARIVKITLSSDETRALLQDVPPVYRTEINDVLLTALLLAFTRWSGSDRVLVELEGHGREDILEDVDLSRTVGWFTSLYPVMLRMYPSDTSASSAKVGAADAGCRRCVHRTHPQNHPRGRSPAGSAIAENLTAVKEQLRRIPRRGIGYGVLRYLHPDPARVVALRRQPVQISFNYLGQVDQGFGEPTADHPVADRPSPLSLASALVIAPESNGVVHSPRAQRSYLIEINGGIAGGQLQLEWSYSENLYRRETVELLANEYLAALREIITHCQTPEAGGVTPSDFSLLNIDQKKLDKILGKISKTKESKPK